MDRPFDVVTFDCYGTLIDWEGGISGAFLSAAALDGITLTRDEVLRVYAEIEPVVEAERYRRYRDVLTESALRVARAFDWELTPERAAFLPSSLPSWRPFADTNRALERLHDAGYRLGILSNIDNDLFAETSKHFTVNFDPIITAEELRSYKPGEAHFLAARERLGGQRWLHAAQSNFHDIVPTNTLGIPNAWINRRSERALPGGTPRYEVRDLAGLADLLTTPSETPAEAD